MKAFSESAGDPPAAVATRDALLHFDHVDRSFIRPDGERLAVLDQLDLTIDRNDFCAVVGPSGCGKSTLFRLAAGLDRPDGGVVRYRGELVEDINTDIGYVTQEAKLFPWMTLRQNLELPLRIRDLDRSERDERIAHFLRVARLDGFEEHYPHQLSGGMQKRASIVRTLIYEPAVVLMDEPFGALDAQTRMLMHQDLLDLWAQHRSTVVFITHDLAEAITLADHVVMLTRRPTSVKAKVAIDIPRPRRVFEPHDMPGYAEVYDALWSELRSEVIEDEGR